MKNHLPPIFLMLLLLLACAAETTEVVVENDAGQIIERYQMFTEDSSRHGRTTEYFENGSIYAETNYNKGKIEGERTLFYKSGQVQIKEHYINGTFQGPYTAFYENGKIDVEGEYINGSMEGVWKKFYESGELKEEVNFKNNEENGPFNEYYKNGADKAKGFYVYKLDEAREHGLLELFNEQGEIIKKMQCDSGLCRTTWTLEQGDIQIDQEAKQEDDKTKSS